MKYVISSNIGILCKDQSTDYLFYLNLNEASQVIKNRIRFSTINYAKEWVDLKPNYYDREYMILLEVNENLLLNDRLNYYCYNKYISDKFNYYFEKK